MATQSNRALFGILFLVFIFFVILMIFAAYTMNIFRGDSFAVGNIGRGKSIAVVEVNSVIMSSKKVIEMIGQAEKDKQTKAIIVRINSPGGAVGPSQEIYQEIRRIDDLYSESDGKEGKPVYASFGSIATSGGYYIGAAARKIYSNPGTVTGSIGVIINYMDMSQLYKWAKLKPDPIVAGRFKDSGGGHRPMTTKERALVSGMLEGVRSQFIRDIMKVRKGKIKGKIDEIAQGQMFSGEEAFRLGLVDELASLWTAGRRIHEEMGIRKDFGLKFIKPKGKKGLWRFFNSIDEVTGGVLDQIKEVGSHINVPMFVPTSFYGT